MTGTWCYKLHNNHHSRPQRPDMTPCSVAPRRREEERGADSRWNVISSMYSLGPPPTQWPLTSLGLAITTITVNNNNTAMRDNTVTCSEQHYTAAIIHSSVSEICPRDYLRLSQSGDELQHGRIFAASQPRTRVSELPWTRVTWSRVTSQPWIQLPTLLRVFPRSVPNLFSEVTCTHWFVIILSYDSPS